MKRFTVTVVVLVAGLLFVAAGEDQVLRVLMPIGGGYTIEDQEAIARGFEQAYPGVRVNMEFVGWGELWTKIITSIGAGAAPDVMYIGSRWVPALADIGAIIPLDEYITPEKRNMYPESIWDTVTYTGKTWGVVRAMSTKVFIYNKDLFAQHGLSVPTTWDELLEVGRTIHDPVQGIYGIAMCGKRFVSTVTQFQQYLYANGGRIVDEEGNVVINAPEAVRALEFYVELSQYAQPGITEWVREDLIKLFETGKVGMYIDHVHNAKRAMEAGVNVGFFLIPGGPDSDQPYGTCMVTDCISITAQSQNRELAWKFVEYMTSFERQAEWDLKLGFVPPMIAERDLPEFQEWYWRPYIEVIEYGYPEAVGIKDWEGTQDAILDAIQLVLLGQADAQTALDQAAMIITILQR
jgi:multiple sugar transport system substrate-binding protein